jgi:integrase
VPAKNSPESDVPRERANRKLTTAEKADARSALALLRPAGLTLTDAARLALASVGRKTAPVAVPVADAVDRFMRAKRDPKAGLRPATLDFYQEQLDAFADDAPVRILGELDRETFKEYLLGLTYPSPSSVLCRMRAVRALCNYGRIQSPPWIGEDPAADLDLGIKLPGKTHPFLTPAVVRKLMEGLPAAYLPAAAIALFAGVRPEEIRGDEKPPLLWEQIDFAAQTIKITAEQSKTHKPRLIEKMEPTVWNWLEQTSVLKRAGSVLPVRHATFAQVAKEVIRKARAKYKQDILRHTYATYHLALTRNPGLVAMALGHRGDPTLLHDTYAGLASEAKAREFFAVLPTESSATVAGSAEAPAR